MFLPRNIDLTANRDFGDNRFNDTLLIFPIDIERELMTSEEYDELIKWEKIFGRKQHEDQKNKIFDSEAKFNKCWENICHRCGKLIKVPWNNISGICKNCNNYLNSDRIPWKEETFEDIVNVRRDLFELR